MTSHADCMSFDRGMAVLMELDPVQASAVLESLEDTVPDLAHLMVAFGFGASYCRPQLTARERQLVTLGCLIALGADRQIAVHASTALAVGLTRKQIAEVMIHSAVYCGFPRAINAVLAAKDTLGPEGGHRTETPKHPCPQ